jgi:hypothetical protein
MHEVMKAWRLMVHPPLPPFLVWLEVAGLKSLFVRRDRNYNLFLVECNLNSVLVGHLEKANIESFSFGNALKSSASRIREVR